MTTWPAVHIGHIKKMTKKKRFIAEFRAHLGLITPTCRATTIARQTYYDWIKADPQFAEECKIISEEQIDFVESKLMAQIKGNNIAGIIFYLKCKAKSRGYIERSEHQMLGEMKIVVDVDEDG